MFADVSPNSKYEKQGKKAHALTGAAVGSIADVLLRLDRYLHDSIQTLTEELICFPYLIEAKGVC